MKMKENQIEKEVKSVLEEARYIEGLLMGLTLGILGNPCVSFLMETIHAYGNTALFVGWLGVFFISLLITVLVSLRLIGRIAKRMIQTINKIFPSV